MTEKGFGVVGLLILLPMLLAGLMTLVGACTLVAYYAESHHLCRKTLLEIQIKMADKVNELLSLNPKAERLRKEEKTARRAVQVAFLPPLKAAAIAYWLSVIARQTQLRSRQFKIIENSQREARQILHQLKRELQTKHSWLQMGEGVFREIAHVRSGSIKLLVYPTPVSSLSPNYNTAPLFSKLQSLDVQWSWDIHKILPRWILGHVGEAPKFQGQCSSTLVQRKGKWVATLGKDKFF